MTGKAKEMDPITLEVVQLSFVNTVREMRATLVTTSYSPILYETHDFSCGLLNAKGQLIGLSQDNPAHIFPLVFQSNTVLKKFEGDIHEGDIFIMNDPYTGGTHLNDVAALYPFFFNGRFSAIIGVRAHFTDVGGATPGSISGKSTSIYQEGIRIPPVKICDKGKMDRGLMEVIFGNMRLPRDREGDYLSMVDTCRSAEVRLKEVWDKYGAETVEECIGSILDRSEEHMKQIISQVPDGVWYYEYYMESSGTSAEPVPIKGRMEIKGDKITFDFTGTAPQVPGPTNLGPAEVATSVFTAVKCLLDPLSPVNSGSFRPINIISPEGTFINARPPAAVGGCSSPRRAVLYLCYGLISQAVPKTAVAGMRDGAMHTMIGAWDSLRKKDFIWYEYLDGGWPASLRMDGNHCVSPYNLPDRSSFHPAEPLEHEQAIRVECLFMRMDSEGAGQWRGGIGMTRRIRNLGEGGLLSIEGGNAIIPNYGVSQGYPGARFIWTIIRNGERISPFVDVPGKAQGVPLEYNDILEMQSTGGGGYGDPLNRDPELVKQDVLDEYITREKAEEAYGVVLVEGEVDLLKTRELREQLRKKRIHIKVMGSKEDDYDGINCRLCRLSKETSDRLGVSTGDLIEYVAKEGAPLRAWVEVEGGVKGEGSPLGPKGRAILKVREGDRVEVRALGGLRRKLT